jgi:hypothetical protein
MADSVLETKDQKKKEKKRLSNIKYYQRIKKARELMYSMEANIIDTALAEYKTKRGLPQASDKENK